MHFENGFAPFQRRPANRNVSVKSTWPKQCRIQNVRSIRRGHDNDRIIGCKSVHFTQDLIECLFAFIMPASKASTALTTNGIDFIDEHDGWRLFFCRRKQIADSRCTDADKHLNEFATVHGKECHSRFSSNRSREKCLARTWRAIQQNAFGYASTQLLKFLGSF